MDDNDVTTTDVSDNDNITSIDDNPQQDSGTEDIVIDDEYIEKAQLHVYTLLNLFNRMLDEIHDVFFYEDEDFKPNIFLFKIPLAVMLDIYFMGKIITDSFGLITGYKENLNTENLSLFNEMHNKLVDWKLPFHLVYAAKTKVCNQTYTDCTQLLKCDFREKFKNFLLEPVLSEYHRYCAENFYTWLRSIYAREDFVKNSMELYNLCWKTQLK